jgi:catechol 2,3-dioxygenase-like lactoylglutathione lyase family enzyme
MYHVQLNASDLEFYRALLAYLEFRIVDEGPDHVGATDGHASVWVMRVAPEHAHRPFHRKATGLNHIAFRVSETAEVDRFCRDFLAPRGIPPLYGGPREYPEYRPGYYAVYFEDRDRIKLEVVSVAAH